jgi:hypothetical protein
MFILKHGECQNSERACWDCIYYKLAFLGSVMILKPLDLIPFMSFSWRRHHALWCFSVFWTLIIDAIAAYIYTH